MANNASEFDGYGNPAVRPRKAKRAGLTPTPTAGSKLRAGYANGTDDITQSRDPAIFNGEDPDRNKELKREVKRRYA